MARLSATQTAALRVARAAKARDENAEADARRDLAEAKIADYVRRCLDAAPPLTDEQCVRLTQILRPRVGGRDQ